MVEMIVFSCSLDSTLAQAKLQGTIRTEERYQSFRRFDSVVLLTQDTQGFEEELAGIRHVPCAYSRYSFVRSALTRLRLIRWLYFSYSSFIWLLRNRSEVKMLISENVDSPTPFIFTSLFKIPYFIHYHYDVAAQVSKINKLDRVRAVEGILLSFLESTAFKRATCVWVTAESLGDKARALGAKKVNLIPNWIDFTDRPRSRLDESGFQERVLFVGRLHPVKRVDLLIKAFNKLRETHLKATLTIVGDGEEYPNLVALTKDLELESSIKFLGFRNHEEVLEIMGQSDIIVLPSIMEGNPRVLVEAMMVKLPIVATDVPGIRDMVKHAKTGHLVSQASPEELASAIDKVLRDRVYADRLAEDAYKYAKQQFSKNEVLKKIQEDLIPSVYSH
jgi:glycosyltransferase involved in cell wall biosynthesis